MNFAQQPAKRQSPELSPQSEAILHRNPAGKDIGLFDFTRSMQHPLKRVPAATYSGLSRKRFADIKTYLATLVLSGALTLCTQFPSAQAASAEANSPDSAAKTYEKTNEIPPRLQWTANFGYCGEVALISAGLYYGQYVSQYDARSIASKNTNQSEENSQLLLGVNDAYAAAQMHLNAVEWKDASASSANSFLAWVKENVASGYPVIIGIYENHHSFDGSNDENAGDAEYDHIVPVTGVSSKHALTKPSVYYADDVITLSDNGLWSPTEQPAYLYHYPFGSFLATRKEANSKAHPIYSMAGEGSHYGVAITGIIDRDGKTLPVRLSTNLNYEKPVMPQGSNTRPKPEDLTLTVTVSGLKPNVSYNLYRYNSFETVPNSGFNAAATQAYKKWKINIKSGSSFSMKEVIKSNQTVIYRAVPEIAP